jgi:hypothetical protein
MEGSLGTLILAAGHVIGVIAVVVAATTGKWTTSPMLKAGAMSAGNAVRK